MNGDFGDFEAHSFIAFKSNDKKYIFDPVSFLSTKTILGLGNSFNIISK